MTHVGIEAHYQKGPFWLATEQIYTKIESIEYDDPSFSSLFVQASWIVNGASRPYVKRSGIFGVLRPRKTVTERGAGLIELGARYSRVDLNGGRVRGGEMSRLSGIANWYLTRGALASFNYGRVRLDEPVPPSRETRVGTTHLFQLRLFLLF